MREHNFQGKTDEEILQRILNGHDGLRARHACYREGDRYLFVEQLRELRLSRAQLIDLWEGVSIPIGDHLYLRA